MADNYYDMTGVLVLKQVTPVIEALFGMYELDKQFPGNGEAYIAEIAEKTSVSWDAVCGNLHELITALGLTLPDDDGEDEGEIEQLLGVLAAHFGAEGNEELANFLEHYDFNMSPDLTSLFTLAIAFDDGHGLKAFKSEASWRCSKPRLFEFGGYGQFRGLHVAVDSCSGQAVELGEALDSALELGNTEEAATLLSTKVGSILAGINDESMRTLVRLKLSEALSAPSIRADTV